MTPDTKQAAARLSAENEINFKKQLQQARFQARLSVTELATRLGLTESELLALERLDSDPTLSQIRQYLTQCEASLKIEVVK